MEAAFSGQAHSHPPTEENRKTVANVGVPAPALPAASAVPDLDASLANVQKRGTLRVGIHAGVPGLCMPDGAGSYVGFEPDLARYIAAKILSSIDPEVQFVSLEGLQRLSATGSWLQRLADPIRKSISLTTTVISANWWNLGMVGMLPEFLCPSECVGALDYVGIDYYWGVDALWGLPRLAPAMECRYSNAPVWAGGLYNLLLAERQRFSDKPILIIENGCVRSASGVSMGDYLQRHIAQVQRALGKISGVDLYLCWSITSNREWGLPFDDGSDFGLYYIALDDPAVPGLARERTDAADRYQKIIAGGSAG